MIDPKYLNLPGNCEVDSNLQFINIKYFEYTNKTALKC